MLLTTAVEVLNPLVADGVGVGRVTSRVPPKVWVSAPAVRAREVAVLRDRLIAFAPAPTAVLAKVWALMVAALPTRLRVEPLASVNAEVAGMMLVEAGTLAKLSVRAPWFTVVAPTKVFAAVNVSVPAPTLVSAPAPESTPLRVKLVPAAGASVLPAISRNARADVTSAAVARIPPLRSKAPVAPVRTVEAATSVVVALLMVKPVPAVIAVT